MVVERAAQVIVVGAGPTGLMLVCELKLMGVDVLLIEKRPTGTAGESRAPGINARTMEVFEQRGIADRFLERGRRMPIVLFSGLPMLPGKLDEGWPDALILPQHETERLLAERATELGVVISWSTQFLHLVQDATGVDVAVADSQGVQILRADYVIGCDGGHSGVRRACGATSDGDDAQSHWLVADVKFDKPPADHESFGRNLRVGTYQLSRAEPGWHRVSIMSVTPPLDRAAPVTLAELRQALLDGLGKDFGLCQARWMSRFTDGFRQVHSYRYGRVLLAGDACHTHAPIGGQGLNLGVQDAVNLGWKLAAVLLDGAPDSLLDTYDRERHAVGNDVLQLSRAQTALIKPGRQIDALREVMEDMLALPELARKYAGILSGIGLRYSWGEGQHPLVGRRMPNLALDMGGDETDVFTLLHRGRPVLLALDGATASVPPRWRERVDVREVSSTPSEEAFWWFPAIGAVPRLSAALLRPDGYVAWASEPGDTGPADALLPGVLRTWLG